ncbi:MAG: hypothetical protein LKI80_16625 [Sporolactobacillus sp.]|nr:hypothetical protein [Sporolactobacillus sp.]
MRKDWASRFETQKGGQITENGRPAPTKVVDIREGTLEHEYGVRIGTKVVVLMGMGCVSIYEMRPTWKSRMFDVNLNTQQAIMSITCKPGRESDLMDVLARDGRLRASVQYTAEMIEGIGGESSRVQMDIRIRQAK